MKFKRTLVLQIYIIVILFFSSFTNAQNTDIDLLRSLNNNRNKSLDPTFRTISNSVVPIGLVAPVIIYTIGFIKKDSTIKKQALFIGQTFLVSAFITTALKYSTKIERPYDTYPDIDQAYTSTGYAFPSGHTSTAFATATSLSMEYPQWYVIAPSFVWALAVGYSRMHLGVHYPSDVIAGAIVGSGSAYLSYKLNKWITKKRKKSSTNRVYNFYR